MNPLVKTIATIIILNFVLIFTIAMSIVANILINGQGLLFVVVGFMTYAANAVTLVLFGVGLFKLWSQSE